MFVVHAQVSVKENLAPENSLSTTSIELPSKWQCTIATQMRDYSDSRWCTLHHWAGVMHRNIPVSFRGGSYIVKFWTSPRSNFLHFHAVFRKNWPNNGLELLFGVWPSFGKFRIRLQVYWWLIELPYWFKVSFLYAKWDLKHARSDLIF